MFICPEKLDKNPFFLQTRAKPGAALQTPSSFINLLTNCFSHPLVKMYLRRCHAQTVKNGASNHKTNNITIFPEIVNPEGHQNCCIGSKVWKGLHLFSHF